MTQPATAGAGPEVGSARVRFRVPDPDAALEEVRLYQEVRRPRVGPQRHRIVATVRLFCVANAG